MRLLHTSDWHLGRSFHGESLLEEQAAALERIVAIAAEAEVDAVLIAGDLYDRAIPPAEAVRLFDRTVRRLNEAGAAVVAIAGNHDSNVRVAVYDGLLATLGVAIRGEVLRCDEPLLVAPRRGGAPVAIYPLPFLDPTLDGPSLVPIPGPEPATEPAPPPQRLNHEEVTRLALARIHADRQRRGGRSVLVAHTFVAGGTASESERELSVGNVERVSVGAFSGFDYVALGHLHGAQELDGPRLAYSGTPLPYSFSEEKQSKSVRLVELAEDGTPQVELVRLGVGRPLHTLEGPLEQLLVDPALEPLREARLRVRLTDAALPLQAMARLRPRFPHIAELRHCPPERDSAAAVARAERIGASLTPLERSLAFFAEQQGREAEAAEERLLRQALEAVLNGADRNGDNIGAPGGDR
ncbi:MAG: exonuclease SbcCD subunit D [Synechococcaceae cyanobacterium]|nr:exonuclease SbcCD subunit D [Synechococcaceae cyanobacterium]